MNKNRYYIYSAIFVVFIYLGSYFFWRWKFAIPFREYQSYDETISGHYWDWVIYDSDIANEDRLLKLGKIAYSPLLYIEEVIGTIEFVSE